MKNFRARLGKRSGQGRGFLWGNYELHLLYRRFAKGEEVTEEKVFSRSFFTFLDTPPFPVEENMGAEKINFTCDARYNTSIAPLFLTFFPLFGRFGYLLFKVSVKVIGDIFSVPMMEEFLPNKGFLGEQEVTKEEAPTAFFTVNDLFREQAGFPGIVSKENKDEQDGDLIAREKKKKAKMGEPSPDPRYYKTYRLFYEHFSPEPPAGEALAKRKPNKK